MSVQTESEPGVASLVSGILQDTRQLLMQQMTLFKVEVKNDIRHTLLACLPLVTGAVISLASLFLFAFALVYLVCWIFPELPLWAGFAIIGALTAATGIGLVLWGKSMLTSNNPLPDKSLEGLKDTLEWKTK